MIFKNREDGGRQLVKKLEKFKNDPKVIILGLPRGGVVTGFEVAKELNLPLDVIVPRKLGSPMSEELAIGAITEDGKAILNKTLISQLDVDKKYIDEVMDKEREESKRRLEKFRAGKPKLDLKGKTAILVDDGVATGFTMLAAISSAKTKGAKKIIVAVPTIAPDTVAQIESEVDELFYLDTPFFFGSVGMFYREFDQTSDEEVVDILSR